ncbi:MAG: aromatic amino acid lyase [Alphaproteobacteria bacterium]
MTVVLDGRDDFTLATLRRVAVDGEAVAFSDACTEKIRQGHARLMDMIENDPGQFIYGVTTRFGEGAKTILDAAGRREQATAPPYNYGTGLGRAASPQAVRSMIFCRLTNFVDGWSAVSLGTARRVADMLDGRALPRVPLGGQNNSGEVPPLLNLFAHLYGDECEEKDTNCIANGSPCASGLVGELALRARHRLHLAEHVFALSIEAANAPLEAYDPALRSLWDDPHEQAALDGLNACLAGARSQDRRPFQAPVAWRVIPRVLGQVHRAVSEVERIATVALRAVTDSPVIVPTEQGTRAWSTGGFHNGAAYPTINWLNMAWADMTSLTARQTTKLMMPEVSELPRNLPLGDHPYGVGTHKQGQRSFSREARERAVPALLTMDEAVSGQTDVTAPTFLAYERELETGWATDVCLALLAATASQALAVADRQPAPPLQPFLQAIRRVLPPVAALHHGGFSGERLAEAFSAAAVSGDLTLASS